MFALLLAILLVYSIVWVGANIRSTLLESNRIGVVDSSIPTISVSASGKSAVANNVATIDLGVTKTDKESNVANDMVVEKVNAIIEAIKALGIEAKDIKTSSYNLYPQYDYSVGTPTITGYEASQTITVKIRNQDLTGQVISKATSLGATNTSNLRFEADEDTAAEQLAREEAIAKARVQAEAIAKSMGKRLGNVVHYSESKNSGNYPGPIYYDRAMGGAEMSVPTIEVGESEVGMSVYIDFEIK